MTTQSLIRASVTLFMVALAALLAWALWQHYMYSPWTRDGRVRARVVQVAPDVSGLVTEVAVADNQTVQQGDLLFVIDRSRYQNALQQAEADQRAAEAAARAAGARGDQEKRVDRKMMGRKMTVESAPIFPLINLSFEARRAQQDLSAFFPHLLVADP